MNTATIGDQVPDGNVEVADSSRYYFFQGNNVVSQIGFNGNDTKRIWIDHELYYVEYLNQTLYELYQQSPEEIIIVDGSLNPMERPVEELY